jgi:hypothetical protein
MAPMFSPVPVMRSAPIASTRACSTASNTPRAVGPSGSMARCTRASWQARRSAMESAWPRRIAASSRDILRGGSGRRALSPIRLGRSEA